MMMDLLPSATPFLMRQAFRFTNIALAPGRTRKILLCWVTAMNWLHGSTPKSGKFRRSSPTHPYLQMTGLLPTPWNRKAPERGSSMSQVTDDFEGSNRYFQE